METRKAETRKPKKTRRNRAKFSKIIIASVLAAVTLFTVAMIFLFAVYGNVPDTLIVSFFGFAGGEAGVLGLIKCADTKHQKRTADEQNDGAAG